MHPCCFVFVNYFDILFVAALVTHVLKDYHIYFVFPFAFISLDFVCIELCRKK